MFFEIVGMIVTGAVVLALAVLAVSLIKSFFAYQRGARNMREYAYSGPDRSEWYWTKYGFRSWVFSFRNGGGWFTQVADPEDDNYDLFVYDNGQIVRKPTRYPG